jgi:hypothetical protein
MSDNGFIPDCPEMEQAIADRCNKHAQVMKEIGKVIVRQDDFEMRIAKLEKTPDEKLDMIIALLQNRG